MLQSYAFWTEERKSHLPEIGEPYVPSLDWRNVEVYVDDMLVKSKDEANHLDDLKETFSTLCKYNMKLNLTKCVFTVVSRKFLGFMVS